MQAESLTKCILQRINHGQVVEDMEVGDPRHHNHEIINHEGENKQWPTTSLLRTTHVG